MIKIVMALEGRLSSNELNAPSDRKCPDLRRSREFSGVVRAERLFRRGLYRFSTEHNSNDAKRLFLRTFPAYPEIIEQSSRLSRRGGGDQTRGE
jgi:hypothetical protein